MTAAVGCVSRAARQTRPDELEGMCAAPLEAEHEAEREPELKREHEPTRGFNLDPTQFRRNQEARD